MALTTHRVTSVEVEISGSWLPVSRLQQRWVGRARASVPILIFLLGRHEQGFSWAKGSETKSSLLELCAYVSCFPKDPLRGKLLCQCGWAFVEGRYGVLPSVGYHLPLLMSPVIKTGNITHFLKMPDKSDPDILLLFLAKSDVKVGRHHIWRLRENYLDMFPTLLRPALMGGRHGTLNGAELAV